MKRRQTPPLHVRPDEMTARHDFALLVKISVTEVTGWLADFRSHVISECMQNSSLIGKELTLEALSSIAVKQMGEEGQLGVRVPQDSSPIAPRIQIATEDGTFRTGSVKELATTRILEGAKVVPVVQVAHLWQESVYIASRLASSECVFIRQCKMRTTASRRPTSEASRQSSCVSDTLGTLESRCRTRYSHESARFKRLKCLLHSTSAGLPTVE